MGAVGDVRDYLDKLSDAQLCDFIAQHEAIEACSQAHKAVAQSLVAQRGCHSRDGSKDLKSWIQEAGRHSRHHADRQAGIAVAVTDLPEIWACFAEGTLSQDQVAVLVGFATPDTDAHWAAEAPKMSVRQLQVCAAQLRKVEKLEQQDAAAEAAATTTDEADTEEAPPESERGPEVEDKLTITPLPGGGIRLCGTFGTVMAEFIEAVLRRQADRYPRDPETGDYEPLPVRMAWALFDLLTTTEHSSWSDRAVVTVHADLATVAGLDDDDATVDWPQPARVCADEFRRLLQNALLDCSLDDLQGRPIGIGHISQQWPPPVFRRIQHRDRGCCRWPGCNNTIGLQVHHEPPFPRGPTDTFHGLLLCVHHHACRTSRGFRITGNPEDELQFWRPDSTLIGTTRPPLDPDLTTLFHA